METKIKNNNLEKLSNICDKLRVKYSIIDNTFTIFEKDSYILINYIKTKYKNKLCLEKTEGKIKIKYKNNKSITIRLKKGHKNTIPKKEILNFILTFNDTIRNSLDNFEKIIDKYVDDKLDL